MGKGVAMTLSKRPMMVLSRGEEDSSGIQVRK
jgi:hypothetical protein